MNSPVSRPSTSVSMIAPVRRPGFDAFNDHLANRLAVAGCAAIVERTHHIIHAAELATQRAARMEAGKVFGAEVAHLRKHQRERVADRQHRGRAGARREAERTGFVELAELDHDARRATDGACLRRGDRYEWHSEIFERRQQLHHFAGLAALREHQHDVAGVDAT